MIIIIDGSTMSYSLTSQDCLTTASCSTTLSDKNNNCSLQYGRDPSFQDLGPPISGPLNSSFPLPLMESSTPYYVQVVFTINSLSVTQRGNFITGEGEKLKVM